MVRRFFEGIPDDTLYGHIFTFFPPEMLLDQSSHLYNYREPTSRAAAILTLCEQEDPDSIKSQIQLFQRRYLPVNDDPGIIELISAAIKERILTSSSEKYKIKALLFLRKLHSLPALPEELVSEIIENDNKLEASWYIYYQGDDAQRDKVIDKILLELQYSDNAYISSRITETLLACLRLSDTPQLEEIPRLEYIINKLLSLLLNAQYSGANQRHNIVNALIACITLSNQQKYEEVVSKFISALNESQKDYRTTCAAVDALTHEFFFVNHQENILNNLHRKINDTNTDNYSYVSSTIIGALAECFSLIREETHRQKTIDMFFSKLTSRDKYVSEASSQALVSVYHTSSTEAREKIIDKLFSTFDSARQPVAVSLATCFSLTNEKRIIDFLMPKLNSENWRDRQAVIEAFTTSFKNSNTQNRMIIETALKEQLTPHNKNEKIVSAVQDLFEQFEGVRMKEMSIGCSSSNTFLRSERNQAEALLSKLHDALSSTIFTDEPVESIRTLFEPRIR